MYTKIHKNQRTKVGAQGFTTTFDEDGALISGAGGGNRQEEILGSHAFDIRQGVKGRVGSAEDGAKDYDVTIGGNEKRYIGGEFGLLAINDIIQTSGAGDVLISAKNNMSLKTTTGIVAIGAGTNVNIQSVATMLLKSGTTYTETVGTTRTSTSGSTWTHTSGGNITITGGPLINLNPLG